MSRRPAFLIAIHAVRLAWRASLAWAGVFVSFILIVFRAYEEAYPTAESRRGLTAVLGANPAVQALIGTAHDVESAGGFVAWRAGGPLTVIIAVWALLLTTRLLRGEEEAKRWDLIAVTRITPAGAGGAVLAGVVFLTTGLSASMTAALFALGLPVGSSVYLGMSMLLSGAAFAAVGAAAAQLASTRRGAATLSGVVLGAAYLVRVVADGTRSLVFMRWATPLGWAEEMRPFAGSSLGPILPLLAWTATIVAAALVLAGRRDTGEGIAAHTSSPRAEERQVRSVAALALRSSRGTTVAWAMGAGSFALVMGLLSKSFSSFYSSSPGLQDFADRLSGSGFGTPRAALSLIFTFVPLPLAVYVAGQASSGWEEESSGRLAIVLAGPVGRRRWLLERAVVTGSGAALIALTAGVFAWAGASLQGGGVSFGDLLRAGANGLPVALFFIGVGALAHGMRPRLTPALTFGLAIAAFLVEFAGSIGRVPGWVLNASPFHHVAAVPVLGFNGGAALVLAVSGVGALFVAGEVLERRDLASA